MNTTQYITSRFLAFFEWGKKNDKYKTAAEFCKIVNVSPQTLNEIVKGRSNISVAIIQSTLLKFHELNPLWIFGGEGEMILDQANSFDRKYRIQKDELFEMYKKQLDTSNMLIDMQQKRILKLELQIKSLGATPVD